MVRVFIKGGVWKNSEDEILKAAVMKYGKQQWARVASLLNRKSAKQCKARWNEWLDPSVRKIEWSRAEDEKLLHLAKLLPAQWKTIGPLVGRTAAQSQERYERLLDEAAQAAESGEGGVAVGAGADAAAAAAAAPGARKLRPGEIDPHPETKPARPDPVDMDEDEIEMLQEARARLANTQGKKAKRKQREKMLAEAKRLADLQKRRELKQAGLLSGAAKTKLRKRSREVDLGVEIPFHKPAPAGFHDVSDERARSDAIRARRLRDVDYKKVNEDRFRSRDREALASQKKEEARLRSLERANMQLVVAEVSKKNDPLSARNRGVLQMPAPAVSDAELEEVAKLSGAMRGAGAMMPPPSAGGSSVTDALLGDYTDRPLPTPMRTPAHAAAAAGSGMTRSESVMREAENLRMLERGQTPLLGEINPTLHEGGAGTGAALPGGSSSAAAASSSRAVDAPTPRISSGASVGATPLQRGLVNQTPVRDELGLNVKSGAVAAAVGGDDASVMAGSVMAGGGGASVVGDASTFAASTIAGTLSGRSMREMAREERRAAKRARRELELALAALPAPQFEYELAIPAGMEEEEEDERDGKMGSVAAMREKDAADVEAEELRRLERDAARMYEARSSVLKREGELPRPAFVMVGEGGVAGDGKSGAETAEAEAEAAEALVRSEMFALMRHDAHAHPPLPDDDDLAGASTDNGDKKKGKKKTKKKRKAGEISAKKASAPPQPLEYLPEEALDAARSLLAEVTEEIVTEKRGAAAAAAAVEGNDAGGIGASRGGTAGLDAELMLHNCETSRLGADADVVADRKERRLAAHRAQFRSLHGSAATLRKRSDRLQSRLAIQCGGYERRAAQLRDEALGHHAALRHAQIEGAVYARLREAERAAIVRRAEGLEGEVAGLAEAEAAAQKKYGDLVHERNRLWKKMAVAAERAKATEAEAEAAAVAGK